MLYKIIQTSVLIRRTITAFAGVVACSRHNFASDGTPLGTLSATTPQNLLLLLLRWHCGGDESVRGGDMQVHVGRREGKSMRRRLLHRSGGTEQRRSHAHHSWNDDAIRYTRASEQRGDHACSVRVRRRRARHVVDSSIFRNKSCRWDCEPP